MEMIEFDRGNFRGPDHQVSKSLGHRRKDLSRTILSARRKTPAPQRERTTSGRAKVADGKRDFVVPTGTDCFARRDCERVTRGEGTGKYIRNGCGGICALLYIGRIDKWRRSCDQNQYPSSIYYVTRFFSLG